MLFRSDDEGQTGRHGRRGGQGNGSEGRSREPDGVWLGIVGHLREALQRHGVSEADFVVPRFGETILVPAHST